MRSSGIHMAVIRKVCCHPLSPHITCDEENVADPFNFVRVLTKTFESQLYVGDYTVVAWALIARLFGRLLPAQSTDPQVRQPRSRSSGRLIVPAFGKRRCAIVLVA